MELNGSHRKWPTAGVRFVRVENVLILFTTMCAFSLMMLLKIEVYSGGAFEYEPTARTPTIRQMAMPAMKTIVAYSAEKQAEMQKKFPVLCENKIKRPSKIINEGGWQRVANSGVSLYAAYYDDRIPNDPYVRILAVADGSPVEDLEPLYCHTWQQQQQRPSSLNSINYERVEAVEAIVTPIWWKEWDPGTKDAVTPLLISCSLSATKQKSFYTSVSTSPCKKSSNVLRVEAHDDSFGNFAKNFTVCVKDMRFSEDVSERLVEWFELLKLLGADKVDVYVAKIPFSASEVLKYYNRTGIVTIRGAPRPEATTSLWQRRRDHLLAYNDCLYRNLRTSRYIVPLDIDEVIVPRKDETWAKMLQHLNDLEQNPPGAASLAVSNAFFFDSFSDRHEVNSELFSERAREVLRKSNRTIPHTLSHLWRSSFVSPVPQYSKSFVSTARALTVFNHYALTALAGAERARAVPPEIALLHHYKAACRPALVDCHQYMGAKMKDDTILRLAEDLIPNVDRALRTI